MTTNWQELQVLAVVKDVPAASHFRFKILVPLRWYWRDADQSRNMNAFYSYARLKPGIDVNQFNSEVILPWYPKFGDVDPNAPSGITLNAQPIADIHLHSSREKEFTPGGNAEIVSAFVAAGILLLIIAVINYVNLSSAIAIRRAKEIAVRKTIGASKSRLFLRFIAESFHVHFNGDRLEYCNRCVAIPLFQFTRWKATHDGRIGDTIVHHDVDCNMDRYQCHLWHLSRNCSFSF